MHLLLKSHGAISFKWLQTSVRFRGSRSQNWLGTIGLILKLSGVKICSSFFLFENYLKKI